MRKEPFLLKSSVKECNKHLARLDYAYSKLAPLLPFTAISVNELSDEEIGKVDQYIFRFSKLQDAIDQKLFRVTLRSLGEEIYDKSFIDIFNRLEQLGVIENYELWNKLREIRNEISHEYDENKYELAEKLNRIISSKGQLEGYLNDTLDYLKNKKIWP